MLNVMHHCGIVSYYMTLYFGVNKIIGFQKLAGNLDKMTIANLDRLGLSNLEVLCKIHMKIFFG